MSSSARSSASGGPQTRSARCSPCTTVSKPVSICSAVVPPLAAERGAQGPRVLDDGCEIGARGCRWIACATAIQPLNRLRERRHQAPASLGRRQARRERIAGDDEIGERAQLLRSVRTRRDRVQVPLRTAIIAALERRLAGSRQRELIARIRLQYLARNARVHVPDHPPAEASVRPRSAMRRPRPDWPRAPGAPTMRGRALRGSEETG